VKFAKERETRIVAQEKKKGSRLINEKKRKQIVKYTKYIYYILYYVVS